MDRLITKIVAGGLSAGVFLIWWPQHIHSDGVSQLVLRGLLWSLLTELLLFMIGPLEQLAEARVRHLVAPRRDRVRSRLDAVPPPARTGGVVALAFCGIAAPLALFASSPAQNVQAKQQPKVIKQVIVKHPVVQKKVVVRKVVTTAPLQSAGAAPSVPTSQVPAPTSAAATATTRASAPAATTSTPAAATTTSAGTQARKTSTAATTTAANTTATRTSTPTAPATTGAPPTTAAAPAGAAAQP